MSCSMELTFYDLHQIAQCACFLWVGLFGAFRGNQKNCKTLPGGISVPCFINNPRNQAPRVILKLE